MRTITLDLAMITALSLPLHLFILGAPSFISRLLHEDVREEILNIFEKVVDVTERRLHVHLPEQHVESLEIDLVVDHALADVPAHVVHLCQLVQHGDQFQKLSVVRARDP